MVPALIPLLALGAGAGLVVWQLRRRGLHRWLLPYLREQARRHAPRPGDPVHLILCIADHYEPNQEGLPPHVPPARVRRWVEDYPTNLGSFSDSDGSPPRHTFFYPIEEYEPGLLDSLTTLCRQGYGEVEIHLHHQDDTAETLRTKLLTFKTLLAERHGLLARRRGTGEVMYGFVHGNWALANSRPDGRWCGVSNELEVLHETGCYADFTLPSAPDPTQTRKINSIYYARGDPRRPKSHDRGVDAGVGQPPPDALLLIQGPLLLDWGWRKWGIVPHLENGCLQASQPPDIRRLPLWLEARVQVPARPDWFFVKLHAHGAMEANHHTLLGEPMMAFHRALARHAAANPNFHYHYVTAREMFNLARAAEAGWTGSVAAARDRELTASFPPTTRPGRT